MARLTHRMHYSCTQQYLYWPLSRTFGQAFILTKLTNHSLQIGHMQNARAWNNARCSRSVNAWMRRALMIPTCLQQALCFLTRRAQRWICDLWPSDIWMSLCSSPSSPLSSGYLNFSPALMKPTCHKHVRSMCYLMWTSWMISLQMLYILQLSDWSRAKMLPVRGWCYYCAFYLTQACCALLTVTCRWLVYSLLPDYCLQDIPDWKDSAALFVSSQHFLLWGKKRYIF